MIISLGMIRATSRDGYGRRVDVIINPLHVTVIIGHCDRSIVFLCNGKNVEVCESAETLEKAWTNIMKNAVECAEVEDLS